MSAGNSAYSPLPQSNSDSDCSSEEELHVSQGNRVVNRVPKGQNSKIEKICLEHKNNINYNLLDSEGDVGVTLNKFRSGPDEVSILKPEGSLEIFSTSRKICFVFSLLLCVFTTVAFIWLLPCNVGSCLSASDVRTLTWERNLPNLEIYGPISLVTDQEGKKNILFLTRTLLDSEKDFFESGLKYLDGKDGSLIWNLKLDGEPTDTDCKLIDVNADGINDCLIFGTNFLMAVNPVSGLELWDIQKTNPKERLYFMDFPLVISDVDDDKINDFLLPCSISIGDEENHVKNYFQNYLVIISGKTGSVINKPQHIKSCSSIHNLTFASSSVLSYTCVNSNTEESQRISLSSLYKSIKNNAEGRTNLADKNMLEQHTGYPNAVIINGFRIVLKNHGDCPGNCDCSVDVIDENKNSKNKTIHHLKQNNAFGMAPVVLKTKDEIGFILKYWKWDSKMKKSSFQKSTRSTPQNTIMESLKTFTRTFTKRSKKSHHVLNSSRILDKAMLLESEWESQRKKRTAEKTHKNRFGKSTLKAGISNLQMITEQIVKISINQSQILTSNIMKNEIFQFCDKPQVCKPDIFQQKQSVLVTPLMKNGKKRLITYTSTYVQESEEPNSDPDSWKLKSQIQILNI